MNCTNIKKWVTIVATAFCVGFVSQVGAIPLTTSDSYYLGVISPDGGSPSEEAAEITHLVSLTPGTTGHVFNGNTYDRSLNGCGSCPAATSAGFDKLDGGINTGSFGSGWTYLLGKYDNEKAGGYVWYVAGLTGDFELPTELGSCGNNGCGISHWTLFNPTYVPEPSSTLLLGLALGGVAFFSRKKVLKRI